MWLLLLWRAGAATSIFREFWTTGPDGGSEEGDRRAAALDSTSYKAGELHLVVRAGVEYENATLTWEKRGSATEGGFLTLLFFDDSRADPSDMTPLCDPSNVNRAVYVNPGKGGWRSGVRGRGSLLIQTLEGLFCVVSIPLFANIFSARRVGREILQHWKSAYLVANSRK